MAAPDHFFVINDENAGFVVHGTTSSIPFTLFNARHMPASS
jgi:hypothetical protein